MIDGISKLLNSKLTPQTNLLIKDFHDSSLFHIIQNQQLIVDKLSDGQIWHQLNQHLQKSISKWDKYMNKIEPSIQMEQEQEQPIEQQEQHEENQDDYDGNEDQMDAIQEEDDGEENQNSQESEKMLEMQEEDVGLYGELLDDQNEEHYENENDEEEDHDLENFKAKIGGKGQIEEEDEVENQNFEHFREIEGQNEEKDNEQEGGDQISRLENRLLNRNDWRWKGQVTSKQRPLNSLVENAMEFKRGLRFDQQGSPSENQALEELIKRRVLDDMFDDRTRLEIAPGFKEHFTSLPDVSVEKSKHSLGELYEMDFTNSLGMKTNKEERQKKQILALFKELNYKLDRLSNFSFIPKPVIESKINSSEPYILREENIPITATSNETMSNKLSRINLKAEKQTGSSHLKTKRIKRQRRKEQEAKRLKRVIEYGGMSKVEAEARKKIEKSKKGKSTKYSQSGQFFKKFQDNISSKDKSKPNPNINKLKL